jgi:MFS family permease
VPSLISYPGQLPKPPVLISQLQLSLNWAAFVVGRVIAGLGVGLISCLSPMYQSETSPQAWRGLVMGLYQWSITIGILLSSIVNNFMATVSILHLYL